jgi:streptogramin lyase
MAPAPPGVVTPAAATLVAGSVTIAGQNFGAPSASSAVVVMSGGTTTRVASTDASVTAWTDTSVTFVLAAAASSGTLAIESPAGRSAPIALEIYEYQSFAIPPSTPSLGSSPLAVGIDRTGRVWATQEFSWNFEMLATADPITGHIDLIESPETRPPDPGPFASMLPGLTKMRWQFSELAEGLVIDPNGRVWFTEGGSLLYPPNDLLPSQVVPNHSRVIAYDPAAAPASRYRVYNVPGDNNQIGGIAWDARRNRVWFAQGGTRAGARVWSFDPAVFPWSPADNTFDFSTSLDALVNAPNGYRRYDLPRAGAIPAQLLVDANGFVWYTYYWANVVGRLDPATGAVVELPLPAPINQTAGNRSFNKEAGGGWILLQAPDGAIVFNEQFDNQINRVDPAAVANPAACLALDAAGRNPCIRDLVVGGGDLRSQSVHSIAYDPRGRLWFTEGLDIDFAGSLDAPVSLGFVAPDWSYSVRLPPLAGAGGDKAPSATGLAIDSTTGDIWFAEYLRHRLSRLRRR